MERVKNYIKEHCWVDILLIIVVTVIFALLFSKHICFPFIDKGREFFLSEQILNGKVPYKDVTLIYFPMAYYINALIYKILGVSIDALVISQTFLCSVFLIFMYFLSKEFLSRRMSLMLTFVVTSASVFSYNDIFSYITPYSYAAAYGYMGGLICVFALVKLFKTDNIKYAYFASLTAGFCLSCKIEFVLVLIILWVSLILYRKISFFQYIKILFFMCLFPLAEAGILYYQGVTYGEIVDAFHFARYFATTRVMEEFLGNAGMYPMGYLGKLKYISINMPIAVNIAILCFIALKLKEKINSVYFIIFAFIYICLPFFESDSIFFIWNGLPTVLLIIFVLYSKKIYSKDKTVLILLISALLISQREFFCLNLQKYGTYPLPLLLLALTVILSRFLPEKILEVKTKDIGFFVAGVLFCVYTFSLFYQFNRTGTPFTTSRGTLYMTDDDAKIISFVQNKVVSNTDEDSKVIVLPEGNIINFITERKADLHCYMMDRLYYDAYGYVFAEGLFKNASYDYVVVMNGGKLNTFNRKDLYLDNGSSVERYIFYNYDKLDEADFGEDRTIVRTYKKMDNKK